MQPGRRSHLLIQRGGKYGVKFIDAEPKISEGWSMELMQVWSVGLTQRAPLVFRLTPTVVSNRQDDLDANNDKEMTGLGPPVRRLYSSHTALSWLKSGYNWWCWTTVKFFSKCFARHRKHYSAKYPPCAGRYSPSWKLWSRVSPIQPISLPLFRSEGIEWIGCQPIPLLTITMFSGTITCVMWWRVGCKTLFFSLSARFMPNAKSPTSRYARISAGGNNSLWSFQLIIEADITDLHHADPAWSIALLAIYPVGAHSSGLIGEIQMAMSTNLMPCLPQVALGKRGLSYYLWKDYKTKRWTGESAWLHFIP